MDRTAASPPTASTRLLRSSPARREVSACGRSEAVQFVAAGVDNPRHGRARAVEDAPAPPRRRLRGGSRAAARSGAVGRTSRALHLRGRACCCISAVCSSSLSVDHDGRPLLPLLRPAGRGGRLPPADPRDLPAAVGAAELVLLSEREANLRERAALLARAELAEERAEHAEQRLAAVVRAAEARDRSRWWSPTSTAASGASPTRGGGAPKVAAASFGAAVCARSVARRLPARRRSVAFHAAGAFTAVVALVVACLRGSVRDGSRPWRSGAAGRPAQVGLPSTKTSEMGGAASPTQRRRGRRRRRQRGRRRRG